MKKPTKAIICAAGLGTRFLPQTKAMPKEMLPIIDKPVIQLIVEEAVSAGVTEVIIVTGSTKRPIEDHFDRADELENELEQRGKKELAQELREVAEMANFIYLRQKGSPKGNALPVLNARHLISDDEPFFVFFADDFFKSKIPRAAQLLNAYEKTGKSIMSFAEVAPEKADQYGMANPGEYKEEDLFTVKGLVEKPALGTEPSLLAQTGCYLLTPDILPLIEKLKPGKGGEIVLGDSISQLAENDVVYGKKIDGTWHDGGNPLGYIKAVIDFALDSEEYKEELSRYLKNRV
ncbi:UTP--glucose-1-phosphate uridylyltransferase [Candidatus Saccharibacteria bacterium]|nr:UTP--glucose-1-phosphate uridylyltransferase [Candidatus Saccharibacteria bacterium]